MGSGGTVGAMKIAGVAVGGQEKETIDIIYHHLQESFPLIEYVERENILGIGEPGRHLMCYFSIDACGLRIKFKGKDAVHLTDSVDLIALADETVRLFQKNEFKLKHKERTFFRASTAVPCASDASSERYSQNEEGYLIAEKIWAELSDMPDEIKRRTFDGCSARVYNALRRRGIVTIGDLCAYTPQEVLSTRNFGYKCILETYRFILLAIGKDAEAYVLPQFSPREIIYETAYADYLAYREEYEGLYGPVIQSILHIADLKLAEREKTVVLARFGIFERHKTLQEIGADMGLTRERIRQIYAKSKRKMLSMRLPVKVLREISDLAQQMTAVPAGGFLAFLSIEGGGLELADFVCARFFKHNLYRDRLSANIKKGIAEEARATAIVQKREKFNAEIGDLIIYPAKKTPSEEFFEKLHTEREVNSEDEGLAVFEYEGRTYACESFLERRVLQQFLKNETFREIKTQSLKIPFKHWFYHPDFQCLTHDGRLVIVEVKPLFRMLAYDNIQKFHTLKAYCEENGFGYLIIDDRNNSYEAIEVHNVEFEKQIMQELDLSEEMRFGRFHEIYQNTQANIKNFLTLIKSQGLALRTPFLLKKARDKTS